MEDELIQYFIVNQELNMSPGKIASQCCHVAINITLDITDRIDNYRYKIDEILDINQWLQNPSKRKIITLKGKQKDLDKLIKQGFNYTIDNGLTEVPKGSITVCGLPPMKRSEAQKYIKRLQLL